MDFKTTNELANNLGISRKAVLLRADSLLIDKCYKNIRGKSQRIFTEMQVSLLENFTKKQYKSKFEIQVIYVETIYHIFESKINYPMYYND